MQMLAGHPLVLHVVLGLRVKLWADKVMLRTWGCLAPRH